LSSIAFHIPGWEGEGFAALYREFYPRVLGICRYLLGSHDEAEDASSEVFLRLPRALMSYDRNLPFGRWLSTVAGRYCLDLLRRRSIERRRFQPASADGPEPVAPGHSPLDSILKREERATVRAALVQLPEAYRVPLELRYYGDLSYSAISDQLGLSTGTVKTRIFRAKKELQSIILRSGGVS
jgi:RNA polymerase sigma factor (sigma-70 family)